ncbi:MAG: ATP-binding protein [Planctomycetaceae bacterium]|nr:ATP-binding protein [Planctomycetaceae bacterium]
MNNNSGQFETVSETISAERETSDAPGELADIPVVLHTEETGIYGYCNDVTLRAEGELNYVLRSDHKKIADFSEHLSNLTGLIFCTNKTACMQIELALVEALNNSLIHGNFEISSDVRCLDDDTYFDLLEERQNSSPYRERHLYVTYRWNRQYVSIHIRDQGDGFDVSAIREAADDEEPDDKPTGRGIIMIKGLMDEVHYNSTGNEITMIKYLA